MNYSVTPSLVLTVWPPFFDEICAGKKTVEGRPLTPRYMNLKTGDLIQIVDKGACNSFVVEITRLTKYSSFAEMLENEGTSNCLPGIGSKEQGVEAYYSFPNYRDQERQYGVIALGIKVHQVTSAVTLSQLASAKGLTLCASDASWRGKEFEFVTKVAQKQFKNEARVEGKTKAATS